MSNAHGGKKVHVQAILWGSASPSKPAEPILGSIAKKDRKSIDHAKGSIRQYVNGAQAATLTDTRKGISKPLYISYYYTLSATTFG